MLARLLQPEICHLGTRTGQGAKPGRTALDLFDLENPTLDWTRLAAGMGVEAARAKRLEELARLLTASFKRPGPFLIELVIT
jgi:acetolactate synthase-1/2/3 large subunit